MNLQKGTAKLSISPLSSNKEDVEGKLAKEEAPEAGVKEVTLEEVGREELVRTILDL